MGADESWREVDKAFSIQDEQELSAGHILEAAAGLAPVPFVAEDFGDMLSALIPMPIDNGLNQREIGLRDGSFSDGYR